LAEPSNAKLQQKRENFLLKKKKKDRIKKIEKIQFFPHKMFLRLA
jgi:hypothetical protein